MKYLIIGGVAGGATTAARLRRISEDAEILIIERGGHISYANCGLPYYIGGVIADRDRLFVQTPESFKENLNIDVRIHTEATKINPENKSVTLKHLETGETWEQHYDTLVLSPGAEPVRPPIPGINNPGIFTLRAVKETDAIYEYIEHQKPRRAVIVGAGFIGLEMAENLHHRGIFVTIIEMAQQVMNVVDYEIAAQIHQHLRSKNVEFYLKDGVAMFKELPRTSNHPAPGLEITLSSGRKVETDMVILSIGVRPESRLAKEAGLAVGETGGIQVNEFLQTSNPHIYAVGDAIEFPNPISGTPGITYLAGPANKQGRICADNMVFGNKKIYKGSIATAIAKVFDVTVASTGLSEKILKKEGIPYESIITHSSSHAGYYPDAMIMTLKTLFDKQTGRVLGAQIVGYQGVDKRIDLIASIIRRGGNVEDLMELEHAYAPPYSSAKDPVNIAGFVAENVMNGRSRHIHWHQIQGCDQDEIQLIDVRTPEEFSLGTIEGSVNLPVAELRSRLNEIPMNKTLVVFCGVGQRAYFAERILRQSGFEDTFNLSGGYKTYEFATQKQSNEDIFANDIIWKDDHIYQAEPKNHDQNQTGRTPPADSPINSTSTFKILEVNAVGLQCPGPIIALKKQTDLAQPGQRIREVASDPGFAKDVEAWCHMTGNSLIDLQQDQGKITAIIEKTESKSVGIKSSPSSQPTNTSTFQNKTTMVVFSDDLDKALASLVIATGAASAGKKVTLFFTFWGLSILKKPIPPKVHKDLLGRLFGFMLPSGSTKLTLSRMNFAGIGPKLMRNRMKTKGVDSLEQMLRSAIELGVNLVACQMSMDLMGIHREELYDEAQIGGVASYLDQASQANINLFV